MLALLPAGSELWAGCVSGTGRELSHEVPGTMIVDTCEAAC